MLCQVQLQVQRHATSCALTFVLAPAPQSQLELHSGIKQHRGQGTADRHSQCQAGKQLPSCGALPAVCSPSPEANERRKVQRQPTCSATAVQPQLRLTGSDTLGSAHLQCHALCLAVQPHVVEAGCGIGVVHRVGVFLSQQLLVDGQRLHAQVLS